MVLGKLVFRGERKKFLEKTKKKEISYEKAEKKKKKELEGWLT